MVRAVRLFVPLTAGLEEFSVDVKSMTGKVMVIHQMTSESLVAELIYAVYKSEGIAPEQQRLIYNSKSTKPHEVLGELGIGAGSLLHMVLRLRGGM